VSSPGPGAAGSRGAVATDPPSPTIGGPPQAAPYFPPPPYPPVGVGRAAPTDGWAITSLAASILGSLAVAGRELSVVATAIGALVSLAWLVLHLFAAAAAPIVG
jgi:hypothetical protein